MTISIQTLHDAIVAMVATVGIAVAAVDRLRRTRRVRRAGQGAGPEGRARARVAAPAQHPTQTDDARELVLR